MNLPAPLLDVRLMNWTATALFPSCAAWCWRSAGGLAWHATCPPLPSRLVVEGDVTHHSAGPAESWRRAWQAGSFFHAGTCRRALRLSRCPGCARPVQRQFSAPAA